VRLPSGGHAVITNLLIAYSHNAEDQVSSATAYVDCYSRIIAKTYAYAAAYAAAAAGCYERETIADATTAVLTKFDAEITKWEACQIDSTEVGLAEGDTDFGSFAGFVRNLNLVP